MQPDSSLSESLGGFSLQRDSQGPGSLRQWLRRSAWVLVSPAGLYLSSLSPTTAWTQDSTKAMSWLDRDAASRLLTFALPSAGVLKLMTFRADAASFPYRWIPDAT